jgi:hypothetical protein
MDYLEFIARLISHIPDQGQVIVRNYGRYANAHLGKVKKAGLSGELRVVKKKPRRIPSKGWAEMIRKIYEVDPMACPKCGRRMKLVAFLTAHAAEKQILILNRRSPGSLSRGAWRRSRLSPGFGPPARGLSRHPRFSRAPF